MINDEQEYLNALKMINDLDFNEEKWLKNYFELYKSTLNWPPGFPPINRTNLIEGTLRKKFNSIYYEILNSFSYKFDNDTKLLISLSKKQK
jgi:hypothetical protein